MLFKLVNIIKPKTLIELGTSIGISTIYQKAASLNGKFISIEGCPETAQVAQNKIKQN